MSGKRKRATTTQYHLAQQYSIPKEQAHTINIQRHLSYMAWLRLPLVRLERFLDNMDTRRRSLREEAYIE